MKNLQTLKRWLDDHEIPGLSIAKAHSRFSTQVINKKRYAYIRCSEPPDARMLETRLIAQGFDVNRGYWLGGTTVEVEVSK